MKKVLVEIAFKKAFLHSMIQNPKPRYPIRH